MKNKNTNDNQKTTRTNKILTKRSLYLPIFPCEIFVAFDMVPQTVWSCKLIICDFEFEKIFCRWPQITLVSDVFFCSLNSRFQSFFVKAWIFGPSVVLFSSKHKVHFIIVVAAFERSRRHNSFPVKLIGWLVRIVSCGKAEVAQWLNTPIPIFITFKA